MASHREAYLRHAQHYMQVLSVVEQLYLQGGEALLQGLALFEREQGNVEAGQAWAAGHAEENEAAAGLCADYAGAGSYCLNLRLHAEQWIRILEAGCKACREIGDRRGEGHHLGNLGLAYAALGQVERAIEHYTQALAIAREIGDRQAEGNHAWNLGLLYEDSEPARAVELMQICVDYEREIGHPDADADAARVAQLRAKLRP